MLTASLPQGAAGDSTSSCDNPILELNREDSHPQWPRKIQFGCRTKPRLPFPFPFSCPSTFPKAAVPTRSFSAFLPPPPPDPSPPLCGAGFLDLAADATGCPKGRNGPSDDAEMKVPADEDAGLSEVLLRAALSRSEFSFACFACCRELAQLVCLHVFPVLCRC